MNVLAFEDDSRVTLMTEKKKVKKALKKAKDTVTTIILFSMPILVLIMFTWPFVLFVFRCCCACLCCCCAKPEDDEFTELELEH